MEGGQERTVKEKEQEGNTQTQTGPTNLAASTPVPSIFDRCPRRVDANMAKHREIIAEAKRKRDEDNSNTTNGRKRRSQPVSATGPYRLVDAKRRKKAEEELAQANAQAPQSPHPVMQEDPCPAPAERTYNPWDEPTGETDAAPTEWSDSERAGHVYQDACYPANDTYRMPPTKYAGQIDYSSPWAGSNSPMQSSNFIGQQSLGLDTPHQSYNPMHFQHSAGYQSPGYGAPLQSHNPLQPTSLAGHSSLGYETPYQSEDAMQSSICAGEGAFGYGTPYDSYSPMQPSAFSGHHPPGYGASLQWNMGSSSPTAHGVTGFGAVAGTQSDSTSPHETQFNQFSQYVNDSEDSDHNEDKVDSGQN